MAMMTDKEKETWKMVGIIAIILVAGYLVLAYANFIPAGYNVFKMGEQEITPTPTPTYTAGTGFILLSADEVNATADPEYTINITVECDESYLGGISLVAEAEDSDSDIWFTATSSDWSISDDGLEATYVGEHLTGGVSFTTLFLNMDNTDLEDEADITITADATLGELDEDEFTIAIVF
jgi:hypothetical protein